MFRIIQKKELNPTVTMMDIYAPAVAAKAEPGQFVILRVDEEGERIPLTIAGYSREEGWIKIIFQIVGGTTAKLNAKKEGEAVTDFVGPLGNATKLDGIRKACVIGGGVGCAIALPIAQKLHASGGDVTSIIGFRNKDLVILKEEFAACSDKLTIMTDDGSYGGKGNVCIPLANLISDEKFDAAIVIGPLVMMKFVVETLKGTGIPCIVSMNPIMIDGTGMCGGCRLTLCKNGQKTTAFACVDGPDFDGYEVDFDEAMSRSNMYRDFERKNHDRVCRLLNKEVE